MSDTAVAIINVLAIIGGTFIYGFITFIAYKLLENTDSSEEGMQMMALFWFVTVVVFAIIFVFKLIVLPFKAATKEDLEIMKKDLQYEISKIPNKAKKEVKK